MNVDLFMRWFDYTFPPLMIILFPLYCFFIRSRPESQEKAAEARRIYRLMWLLAGASLAVYFVAYTYFGGGQWRQLWTLCFLQMPLMNKLLMAKNPSWTTPYPTNTRVAPLVNRQKQSAIPAVAWALQWALWAMLAAAAASGYFYNELPMRLGMMILIFGIGQAAIVAFGPMMVKAASREPEPLDPKSSLELVQAYERHRKARAWMFFCMPLIFVLLFGGCSVAIAWLATTPEAEANIGLYGGIAGSIAGIAGGVAGAVFGAWRAKLNQTVRDLTAEQQTVA